MPSGVESRDELTSRYVLGEAVETFVKILAGLDIIAWTLDGPPFNQFIPEDRLDELDTVLRRMGDEDFSALWPMEEDEDTASSLVFMRLNGRRTVSQLRCCSRCSATPTSSRGRRKGYLSDQEWCRRVAVRLTRLTRTPRTKASR